MLSPKIHRVRIEKFRRIQDVFEADLTTPREQPVPQAVFAGPNGSGKTTILEAILLGLGQEERVLQGLKGTQKDTQWRTALLPDTRIELDVSVDNFPVRTWLRTSNSFIHKDDGSPVSTDKLAVEYFSSWRAPLLGGSIKPL